MGHPNLVTFYNYPEMLTTFSIKPDKKIFLASVVFPFYFPELNIYFLPFAFVKNIYKWMDNSKEKYYQTDT